MPICQVERFTAMELHEERFCTERTLLCRVAQATVDVNIDADRRAMYCVIRAM
jgi:hypothetical protein